MRKEPLDHDRIFVVHDFLNADECRSFVTRSEQAGYDDATIKTALGESVNKGIRDNARLILDDPSLALTLWERVGQFIPSNLEGCRVLGLNERFRFYRYDPGQKFAPHFDGYFERGNERSQLTFMVYLNDDFTGGETKFYGGDLTALRVSVRPQRGMALVFAHLQLHEGAAVVEGRKYVLRTDVMYAGPEAA